MTKLVPLSIAFGILSLTAVAFAFPFLESWHDPADGNGVGPNGSARRAGGGDIYGTGSTQDWGIKCSDCHVRQASDPATAIDVRFTVTPAWQDVSGSDGYQPDTVYHFVVDLVGEHLGLVMPQKGNHNGIVVEMEDVSGDTAGIYYPDAQPPVDSTPANCPANAPTRAALLNYTTYVYGDCHGVLFTTSSDTTDRTEWSFDWRSPAVGTGEVTIFYGMVDGDGGEVNRAWNTSSLNDDVKEGTIILVEGT